MRRAVRLEWITLFFLSTIVAAMALTSGASQAMKAALAEDMLSLVPPIAFLFAVRFKKRPPDERFPYGRGRAMSISFLIASTAVLAFGLFILIDSALKLVRAEHPSVGLVEVFGHTFWSGWLMIGALVYSVIPPVILGRMKLRLARELHERTLHADASMNKADWMTGIAGVLGVVGIGFGYWWADGVAAGLIALDIVHDGAKHLKQSFGDLMDRRPECIDDAEPDPIAERMLAALRELDWVEHAEIRLREEGQKLAGEAFVVPADNRDLTAKLDRATRLLGELHWRVGDVFVIAVPELPPVQRACDESEPEQSEAELGSAKPHPA